MTELRCIAYAPSKVNASPADYAGGSSIVLVHAMLRLPSHKVTSKWEQGHVDRAPGEQDAKVETNPAMQAEQDLSASFDDRV